MHHREARFSSEDAAFMRRALRLAARGKGFTSPNPAVGAVVVSGRRIVGEAWHRRSGGAHAEAQALARAGAAARRGTLYVTMEPCCTFGRTPPCTEAILSSGVRRVVVAARDPNPRHCGRGIALLRRRGLRVDVGLLSDDACRLIEDFAKYIREGRPFTTVKVAMTLDGKIATPGGDSRWISGPEARQVAHRLRLASDAVLVGRRTAERDDPLLTARPRGLPRKVPWRIIVDSQARIPLSLKLLKPPHSSKTIVAVTDRAPRARIARLEALGVRVIRCRSRGSGVSLRSLWRKLAREGIMSLVVEGGGELITSALESGLVDKVAFFISPKILGGVDSPGPVGGTGVNRVSDALILRRVSMRRVGGDALIEGYLGSGQMLKAKRLPAEEG